MWEFIRKIGLGFKQVPHTLPCPEPDAQRQTKSSVKAANRAAGREELAKFIPTLGSDGSIPMMEQLVLHGDVFVRGEAKRAAAEAVASGKATESFRSAFWEALIQDLLSDQVDELHDPVRFLLKLDEEKTLRLLNTPAFLRTDHPIFRVILQTLVFQSKLDCATISRLRRGVPKNAHLQNTLRLAAAKSKCPGIGEELDNIIADQRGRPSRDFQEWEFISALRSRLELAGMRHPESSAWETNNPEYIHAQQDLSNIGVMNIIGDDEFYAGAGFPGLFSRDECDDHSQLMDSLRRLQLWDHLKIFERAMQKFNGQAPWPCQEIRQQVRDTLENAAGDAAEIEEPPSAALEAEWIALKRDLVVAVEDYAFKAAVPIKT